MINYVVKIFQCTFLSSSVNFQRKMATHGWSHNRTFRRLFLPPLSEQTINNKYAVTQRIFPTGFHSFLQSVLTDGAAASYVGRILLSIDSILEIWRDL
jgi:hypothetical protein